MVELTDKEYLKANDFPRGLRGSFLLGKGSSMPASLVEKTLQGRAIRAGVDLVMTTNMGAMGNMHFMWWPANEPRMERGDVVLEGSK